MPSLPDYKGRRTLLALLCIALGALVLLADYYFGPFIQFPFLFLIPVSLAAWYCGWAAAAALAAGLVLVRLFYIELLWLVPWPRSTTFINAAVKMSVLILFAFALDHLGRLVREVKVLRGFLPICSFCKKIRTDSGSWEQMEQYISEHSEASFTHSVCRECQKSQYGLDDGDRA